MRDLIDSGEVLLYRFRTESIQKDPNGSRRRHKLKEGQMSTRRFPSSLVLLLLCVAQFIVAVDFSIVNVALSSIQHHTAHEGRR